jgi:transcriptional regulator GlxA family with amidase domain
MTRPCGLRFGGWTGQGCGLAGSTRGRSCLPTQGLLDGCRATCHWETLGAMREDYPRVDVSDALYEIDGARLTASGGTAPLDMMIAWIGSLHGQALATRVADTLVHARYGGDPGGARIAARTRFGTDDAACLPPFRRWKNTWKTCCGWKMWRPLAGRIATPARTPVQGCTGHGADAVLPGASA